MNTWLKAAGGGALALALMGGTAAGAEEGADVSKSLQDLRHQLEAMHNDIEGLNQRLKKIEDQIAKAQEPPRFDVNLDRGHALGDSNAKYGIVEFADFQCPYCRHFYQDAFPKLKKNYLDTGKAVFMVRNFPLDFHAHAMRSALAVSCVAKQDSGAYWQMQEALFTHQDRLGDEYFNGLVRQYGLDDAKYQACMKDAAERKRVQDDLTYAQSLGVSGTPTFFIGTMKGDKLVNAVRMEGAQPYEVFAKVLDYVRQHEKVAAR